MAMLKGMSVQLYDNETSETVYNILVGEPARSETAYGLAAEYTLGIPKGDSHLWIDRKVRFFERDFQTIGEPLQGIEENIPLSWGMNVKVRQIISNGNCTIYKKNSMERHILHDVCFHDNRGHIVVKDGEKRAGTATAYIYSVNNTENYIPEIGDIFVFGECDFEFDTADQKAMSESMKEFKADYPNYCVVRNVTAEYIGTRPNYEIVG